MTRLLPITLLPVVLLTSTLAAVALVGCGSARRGAPLTGEHVPPTAEIRLGQRVFDAHCNGCHPGGAAGLGPALNNKPLPGWAIRFQVRHGLGAMPAFPLDVIPPEELDALVAYLVWLRRLDPASDALDT
jgi:mono/diheme cytochrome c family protein